MVPRGVQMYEVSRAPLLSHSAHVNQGGQGTSKPQEEGAKAAPHLPNLLPVSTSPYCPSYSLESWGWPGHQRQLVRAPTYPPCREWTLSSHPRTRWAARSCTCRA